MPFRSRDSLSPLPVEIPKIHKQIIKFRKLSGLTQQELANKIGIKRDALASYEVGRSLLNNELLVRFALVFKVSLDKLVGLKSSKEENPPSLRLVKRMQKIEKLSLLEQKTILKMIDTHLKGLGVDD